MYPTNNHAVEGTTTTPPCHRKHTLRNKHHNLTVGAPTSYAPPTSGSPRERLGRKPASASAARGHWNGVVRPTRSLPAALIVPGHCSIKPKRYCVEQKQKAKDGFQTLKGRRVLMSYIQPRLNQLSCDDSGPQRELKYEQEPYSAVTT